MLMDIRSIDLDHLETFLAVAEERGFSRAATRLHRTQPAVSQVIRKLEGDLGEVLFERSSRAGTLTAAGEVLREYAHKLLKLRAEAANAIEELRTLERGRLLVAANEYTCLYLLPVLDRFQQLYPQVGVTVQRTLASRIPQEVLERSAEIGVLSYSPEGDQFRSIAVYNDELTLVVSPGHPLTGEGQAAIEDLGAESFIGHNVPSPLRRQVIAAFAHHKTPLNMRIELPSIEAIKLFVAMGRGVALVPGLTVVHELERGELVKIKVEALRFERPLRLIHRKDAALSHAAAAFFNVVRSFATEQGWPFEFRAERPA